MVLTDDQEETDRYWNAIVGNGGQESACGWCKDRHVAGCSGKHPIFAAVMTGPSISFRSSAAALASAGSVTKW
jgi:hypothetical protein